MFFFWLEASLPLAPQLKKSITESPFSPSIRSPRELFASTTASSWSRRLTPFGRSVSHSNIPWLGVRWVKDCYLKLRVKAPKKKLARNCPPKMKNHRTSSNPTIDFQNLLLLVSGTVEGTGPGFFWLKKGAMFVHKSSSLTSAFSRLCFSK